MAGTSPFWRRLFVSACVCVSSVVSQEGVAESPTCSSFKCEMGFTVPYEMSSSTLVTHDNCCKLTTCLGYKCPDNYVPDDENRLSEKLELDTCCMTECRFHKCQPGSKLMEDRIHWNSKKDTVNEAMCCQEIYEDVTALFRKHADAHHLVNVRDTPDGDVGQKKCCCGRPEGMLMSDHCKLVDAVKGSWGIIRDPNGCKSLVGEGWHNYDKINSCKITWRQAEELRKTIVPKGQEL